MNAKKLTGLALATAAAGIFMAASLSTANAAKHMAEAADAKVKCDGINACKGKSECATAKNSCKGQNACKGQGMSQTSAKECTDKGGKIEKPKA